MATRLSPLGREDEEEKGWQLAVALLRRCCGFAEATEASSSVLLAHVCSGEPFKVCKAAYRQTDSYAIRFSLSVTTYLD